MGTAVGGTGTAVGVSYLCGKTVGVIAGGAVVQSLQSEAHGACKGSKPIQVHEFPTDPEATQALLSQQVATHGNGFGSFLAVFGRAAFATDYHRLQPRGSIKLHPV